MPSVEADDPFLKAAGVLMALPTPWNRVFISDADLPDISPCRVLTSVRLVTGGAVSESRRHDSGCVAEDCNVFCFGFDFADVGLGLIRLDAILVTLALLPADA